MLDRKKLENIGAELKRLSPLLLIVIAGVLLISDAAFMVGLSRLSMIALIIAAFHIIRKKLFPYIDLKVFTGRASESPVASAIVVAALLFFLIAMCYITVAHSATMSDEKILQKARPYMPVFRAAVYRHWPKAPHREHLTGKVEQETCTTLAKCWNPGTELKTDREYGFGLSQMTVAHYRDGSVRFNKFEEAKQCYKELSAWRWDDRWNVEYHLTFITLESKRLYDTMWPHFRDSISASAASLVAYNAGSGTVLHRRALCSHTKGCDETVWFGGLDSVMMPGEERLLYGKPLYQRRNEYPDNIIHKRAPKYVPLWREV